MKILSTFGLILGIISLVLFIIATIVIVRNKKMTTIGKILRMAWILIFPAIGSITVLLEVLDWREKELRAKKAETKKIAA